MNDKEIDAAWTQMGLTPAGRMARLKLVRRLQRVPSIEATCGALQANLGERTLAAELLTLLDAEIPFDARSDLTDTGLRGRPKPADGRQRPRGAERRVPIDPPHRV